MTPTPDRPQSEPPTSGERVREFAGTGIVWGLVAGIAFAAVVVVLIAQNLRSVGLTFLAWDFRVPVVAVVLGSALVGVVADELVGVVYRRRRRRQLEEGAELRRLRRRAGGRQ